MKATQILMVFSIVSTLGTELTLARQIDVIGGGYNEVNGMPHNRQRRAPSDPLTDEEKELFLSSMNHVRSTRGSSSMNQLVN